MSIKLRIIILSLVGNFAIAAIFLVLAQYQSSQKDQAAIESSSNVYGQAWRTVLNDSFNNSVGFYHPQSGDPEKITIWADNPAGQEAGLSGFFAESRDVQDLRDFIDIYFEEAFAWGELSFVMAFDREGLRSIAPQRMRIWELTLVLKRQPLISCQKVQGDCQKDPMMNSIWGQEERFRQYQIRLEPRQLRSIRRCLST